MAIFTLTHFSSIIVHASTKLLKDFRYELINIMFLFSFSFPSELRKILDLLNPFCGESDRQIFVDFYSVK